MHEITYPPLILEIVYLEAEQKEMIQNQKQSADFKIQSKRDKIVR